MTRSSLLHDAPPFASAHTLPFFFVNTPVPAIEGCPIAWCDEGKGFLVAADWSALQEQLLPLMRYMRANWPKEGGRGFPADMPFYAPAIGSEPPGVSVLVFTCPEARELTETFFSERGMAGQPVTAERAFADVKTMDAWILEQHATRFGKSPAAKQACDYIFLTFAPSALPENPEAWEHVSGGVLMLSRSVMESHANLLDLSWDLYTHLAEGMKGRQVSLEAYWNGPLATTSLRGPAGLICDALVFNDPQFAPLARQFMEARGDTLFVTVAHPFPSRDALEEAACKAVNEMTQGNLERAAAILHGQGRARG